MGKARKFFGVNQTRNDTETRGTIRTGGSPSTFETVPNANHDKRVNPSTYFKKTGDFMNGTFALGPVQTLKVVSGILVIDTDVTLGTITKRSVVNVIPNTGTTATITNIQGGILPYEFLLLVGTAGNTITLQHNAGGNGNILCPGDTNYTLAGDETVLLVLSDETTAATEWRVYGHEPGSGGGGSASEPYATTLQTPSSTSGTLSIDFDYHTHTVTVDENITTINFTNVPSSGNSREVSIRFDHDGVGGTFSITWPSAAGGSTFTLSSGQSARYVLHTEDGGTSYEIQTLLGATIPGVTSLSQLNIDSDLDLLSTFNVLNFGFLSQGGTEATSGALRFINNVSINWRNAGNTANFGIKGNASDQIEINADFIPSTTGVSDIGSATKWFSDTYTGTLNLGDATDNYTISGLPTELEIDYGGNLFTITNSVRDVIQMDADSVDIKADVALNVGNIIDFTGITAPASLDRNIIYSENLANDDLVLNVNSSAYVRMEDNGTEFARFSSGEAQVGSSTGYNFNFLRDAGTAFDDDVIASMFFQGNNDAGTPVTKNFARINVIQKDVSSGTEDGEINFSVIDSGVLTEYLSLTSESTLGRVDFFNNVFQVEQSGSLFWSSTGVDHLIDVNGTTFTIDTGASTDTIEHSFGGNVGQLFTKTLTTLRDTSSPILSLHKDGSGAGGAGTILLEGDDSAGNQTTYGSIQGLILDSTNTAEDGEVTVNVMSNGTETNAVDITGTSSGIKIGVFGSTGTTKQTLTGSTGGNAALQNLITLLANHGWLTDSTT